MQVNPKQKIRDMKTGLLIRELRKQKGWTMEVLAEKMGVAKSLISHWENGAKPPKERIIELCAIFEVPETRFLVDEQSGSIHPERFEELNSTVDFLKSHIEALMEEKKELMKMLELALKGNFPGADPTQVIQISPMRLVG